MSDTLPSTHTAGDSAAWLFDAGDCAPADGWTAKLILVGATRHEITCTTSGEQFAAAATSVATAAWQPGNYAASLVCTLGTDRVSRAGGSVRVLADPAAEGTTARSLLTDAEAYLADLEAAYRAHMASGNAVVAEYRIGTRMKQFKSVADLLTAINAARRDVQAEQAAAGLAAGVSSRQRFVVRM
ncbi:hypothetical protein [Pelomonas sp. Root1444]|uniref:hypothetical protein n=1 Tax=Pelomonas sp. Root1444 TaxID=1736464 RepID=UPI000703AFCC|nr:hypothetical protein [Pelomonas sp. Root1444]KQY83662.1 hypothetical protein ASD35_24365 [Pelomonas sp. Root1444]